MIGGARLTNEGAYAWAKLAKGVLGTDSVDAQLGDGLPAEVVLGLPRATIDQAAAADTVDRCCPATSARSSRSCSSACGRPSWTATCRWSSCRRQATSLTPYAAASLRYRPAEAADLVAGAGRPGLGTRRPGSTPTPWPRPAALVGAGTVVVVVGRPSLAEDGALVAEAAQVLARALPDARFLPALRRGNVHGALDMGLAPGLLPGRVDPGARAGTGSPGPGARCPRQRGRDTAGILAAAAEDPAEGPGSARWSCSVPIPSPTSPTPGWPDGPSTAPTSWWRWPRPPARSTEPADVVLPAAEAHERPGHHHQHRGPDQPAGPEAGPARPGLARLDDRRRAGRPPGRRPGPRLGRRRVGRDRAAGPGLPRASPGPSSTAPAPADGVVAPLGGHARSSLRPPARPPRLDPIAVPGVESVERQGAPPRAGLAEAAHRRRSASPGPGGSDHGRRRRPAPAPAVRPGRARRAPRGPERQLLVPAGGLPGPLRPGRRGGRGAGPGRPGGRRRRCGPTPTTSTTSGWPPGGSVRLRTASASPWS